LTTVIHLHGLMPATAENGEAGVEVKEGPGPIVPEVKELAWGAGSFVVFALLMRFVLFPKLKRSMAARYASIREGHEQADAMRTAARTDVAEYEAQLAAAKAEAAAVIERARQTVEADRQVQVSALNARLAERRAAAQAEADAARAAVSHEIHAAVVDVAARAGELATGRRPDQGVLDRVVDEVMAR
jgi:F-type H+-transporting ATPase subunit b